MGFEVVSLRYINQLTNATMKNQIELQKEMTKEELIHFFSQTTEFTVGPASSNKEEDNNELIPNTYEIHCEGESLLIYKPTIQTLIRSIWQLSGLVARKG